MFTSGCTAALKLLAETFDFSMKKKSSDSDSSLADERSCINVENDMEQNDSRSGCFCYLLDNHTSVCGMREVVKNRVNSLICLSEVSMMLDKLPVECYLKKSTCNQPSNALFVYPAQSNYCGRKYPMEWLDKIKQKKMGFQQQDVYCWYTVLDAACFIGTSELDLGHYKPDFVTLSFYKMFGFPTGLGEWRLNLGII